MAGLFEVFIIAILILANGFFSMAEFALVSARKVRLKQMADKGSSGAVVALSLSEDTNTLLSAIQIGITLIGIFAGVYSGATIAGQVSDFLIPIPIIGEYHELVGMIFVVIVVSYATLVFGELVPKRMGLGAPEKIASLISKPIRLFVRVTAPITWITAVSTDFFFRFIKRWEKPETPIAEEEISVLLEEGTQAGEFDKKEQEIVRSVFRFGDQQVASLMVPRPDIIVLDLDDSYDENLKKMLSSGHTRYPVCRNGLDSIVGVISIRDLWAHTASGGEPDLSHLVRDVLVVPEQMSAISLLEEFKNASSPLSILVDEYGSVVGIVTLHDLMEAIVGDLSSGDDNEEPQIIQRDDGSWFIDGMMPVEDLKDLLRIDELPGEEEGFYRTTAGYVMAEMGRVPVSGDSFIRNGVKFEVADMDAHRIDKIIVSIIKEQKREQDI